MLNLEILQLDVKTAFLNGDLDEDIYMAQPEGFIAPGHEEKVCKLKLSLYGPKQASRACNLKFHSFLTSFCFVCSSEDQCNSFIKEEKCLTVIAIWLDDGLVCSSHPTCQCG